MSDKLKINITSKLDISMDQEQSITEFMQAMENLPKAIGVKFSLDNGKTWGDSEVQIDLLDLIRDVYFT